MSERTGIQWTQATWNPWHGCHKVSPGCKNCYMFREKRQYGQDPDLVVRSKTKFNDPLKWTEGRLIFTCSWSDWFIKEADPWRAEAWEIIRRTPQHTYQILTKRIERAAAHLPDGWPFKNVWLIVSVEDQKTVDLRIPQLAATPAFVRGISLEPQLSHVQLGRHLRDIQWVIQGGESGPDARPFSLRWAHYTHGECRASKTAYFLKQVGSRPCMPSCADVGCTHPDCDPGFVKLHDAKGGDMAEWPPNTPRVREFPA